MLDASQGQIEALAQSLYEQLNPGSVPWRDRTRTVREAWLREASRRLKSPEEE